MSTRLLMNTAMFLVVMKTTKQVQGLVYRKFLNLNIPSTNGYSLSNGDVKGMATATTMLVAVLPQPTNQHNHACGSTWHVPPGSLNTKMVSVRLENIDTLSDDLYQKTVKPAASAFGVVSYDRNTDSTLLVRSGWWGLYLVLAVCMGQQPCF
jgi:hypothetical protein